MTIAEMNLEQLEVRSLEIAQELTEASEERLAELNVEADEINERKAELKAQEERQAIAEKIKAGEAEPITIEKEEKSMEERTFAPDTVEYRDAYLKSLMGKSMSIEERTALSVAANVIPKETLDKIYGKLEENPLLAEIDALHIPGYVSVPVATTVNDAAWTAMATAATDSADVIGTVALTAKKLIKTIEITADVQAMSISGFQSWLVNKLAQKMEKAIVAGIINGAGTNDPVGVGQCGITASTGLVAPDLEDFAAFMAGVGSAYHKDAVWVMSAENFYTYVVPLAKDSNGVLVMNGIDNYLMGHKVIFTDAVDACKFKSGSTTEANNADHVIFGNFKEGYVFNYGEGINIEADGSVAFRTGSVVYRAMALADGAVADKEAFAWTTIAAS